MEMLFRQDMVQNTVETNALGYDFEFIIEFFAKGL